MAWNALYVYTPREVWHVYDTTTTGLLFYTLLICFKCGRTVWWRWRWVCVLKYQNLSVCVYDDMVTTSAPELINAVVLCFACTASLVDTSKARIGNRNACEQRYAVASTHIYDEEVSKINTYSSVEMIYLRNQDEWRLWVVERGINKTNRLY